MLRMRSDVQIVYSNDHLFSLEICADTLEASMCSEPRSASGSTKLVIIAVGFIALSIESFDTIILVSLKVLLGE